MNLRLTWPGRSCDSTEVWPGGNMYSRGSRRPFLARYQKCGSNSSRAWLSVSAT